MHGERATPDRGTRHGADYARPGLGKSQTRVGLRAVLPTWQRGQVDFSGSLSADGRRHIQLGSLRDLDRSPPRGCRYHQDPSRTCTGRAVASGISFACPSSAMAIVQKLLPIRRTNSVRRSSIMNPASWSLLPITPCPHLPFSCCSSPAPLGDIWVICYSECAVTAVHSRRHDRSGASR